MFKARIKFLFILLVSYSVDLLADQIAFEDFMAYKSCETQSEEILKIKNLLDQSYERIKIERRIVSWELIDRHDRIPHYCIGECACLYEEYSNDLQKKLDQNKYSIHGVRLSGGKGILPVEVKTPNYKHISSYFYHITLILKDKENECFIVFDPIISNRMGETNKPLTIEEWANYIPSLADNRIFLFNKETIKTK